MDTSTFKQCFLPCSRRLYGVAFRLTRNVQEAEDFVQYRRLFSNYGCVVSDLEK
jgi:RNA polymerase sigma-70 factor (ECF subfamily)